MGNTCYLNAALQCLLHCPGLTNYVLSGYAEKDVMRRRALASALATEYVALTKQYWTTPAETLDTTAVWTALCKLHKPFGNRVPHDAHEAVTVLIKHLHDALGKTPRIRPSVAEAHVDVPEWERAIAKEGYSILTELFVGQTQRIVEGGEYRSVSHEHFVGLSLDLEGCSTITHAVAKAFAPEQIEGYVIGDTTRQVTLTKVLTYAPLTLVIHLKRFDGSGTKIDRFVDYTTTLVVPGQGTYELFGVCFHSGGHYVAACEVGGSWRAMDDDKVTCIGVNDVIQKDAYVLFYKKRM